LEREWEAFYDLPFPGWGRAGYATHQESDEMGDLHASLAEYDGYIAGLVMQAVTGATRLSHPLMKDPELRERFERLAWGGSPEVAADARDYLEYLDRIDRLIEVTRAHLKGLP
jgi:hypothetical protein